MNAPAPEIPDHSLLHVIGRGSYGDVWLARTVTGAERAVKIVRRNRFEDDAPFEREFDALRCYEPLSRSDAGLVHVLHAGRGEGCLYYVMELADNAGTPGDYAARTLRLELRKSGRLPLDEVLALGMALARALEKLHTAGLAHGDVKPANIIYVAGQPKLADIGMVSTRLRAARGQGTAAYNPPEGSGTVKGDIFSAGLVLYEAATGRAPTEFPSIPEEWTQKPGSRELQFTEVLLRASERDPAARYASTGEMLADLASLQKGEPPARRATPLVSRRAVLALGGTALAAAWVWRRTASTRVDGLLVKARKAIATGDRAAAIAACRAALAASPEREAARDLLATALALPGGGEAVFRIVGMNAPVQALAFLGYGRALMAAVPDSLGCVDPATGAVIASLQMPGATQLLSATEELFVLQSRPGAAGGAMVAMDAAERGGVVYFRQRPMPRNTISGILRIAVTRGSLRIIGATRSGVMAFNATPYVLDGGAGFSDPVTSASERDIAAVGPSGVAVWDSLTLRHRLSCAGDAACGVSFSADSTALVGSGRDSVTCWDARSGAVRWMVPKSSITAEVIPPVSPPPGRWIAVGDSPAGISILDMDNGRTVVRLFPPVSVKFRALAASQDGRWLGAAGDASQVLIWDLDALRREAGSALAHWPGLAAGVPSPLKPLTARAL